MHYPEIISLSMKDGIIDPVDEVTTEVETKWMNLLPRLPFADWIDNGVDWLVATFGPY